MTTDEVMSVALDLAGWDRVPGDSAVFVPGASIRRVLFGLDVGVAELQLARSLGVDLVIAHHPPAPPAGAAEVFSRHVEFMTAAGVPADVAQDAVAERLEALRLRAHVANTDHVPSAARLLGMPFMNIHAPLDEVGRRRLVDVVDDVLRRGSATAGDLVEALGALPEVRAAPAPVRLALGDPSAPVRRVLVAHGAYTNGGYPVARACFASGVDAVIYLHIDFADLQRLRAEGRGALILLGHLAGDSLGFTPFLAALRRRGLEVLTFSGVLDLAGGEIRL